MNNPNQKLSKGQNPVKEINAQNSHSPLYREPLISLFLHAPTCLFATTVLFDIVIGMVFFFLE